MTSFILKLVLSHLLGDFLFQPDTWVKDKENRKHASPYLYLHIIIHITTLLVVLQFNMKYWLGIIIIAISHFIIDLLKVNLRYQNNARFLFFFDQTLHISVIAAVVY